MRPFRGIISERPWLQSRQKSIDECFFGWYPTLMWTDKLDEADSYVLVHSLKAFWTRTTCGRTEGTQG
jgi:hypothetical protein